VRERTGAKVHLCDAEPGRRDRVITISLIDGGRCASELLQPAGGRIGTICESAHA
jgi:hypothetical protein